MPKNDFSAPETNDFDIIKIIEFKTTEFLAASESVSALLSGVVRRLISHLGVLLNDVLRRLVSHFDGLSRLLRRSSESDSVIKVRSYSCQKTTFQRLKRTILTSSRSLNSKLQSSLLRQKASVRY